MSLTQRFTVMGVGLLACALAAVALKYSELIQAAAGDVAYLNFYESIRPGDSDIDVKKKLGQKGYFPPASRRPRRVGDIGGLEAGVTLSPFHKPKGFSAGPESPVVWIVYDIGGNDKWFAVACLGTGGWVGGAHGTLVAAKVRGGWLGKARPKEAITYGDAVPGLTP